MPPDLPIHGDGDFPESLQKQLGCMNPRVGMDEAVGDLLAGEACPGKCGVNGFKITAGMEFAGQIKMVEYAEDGLDHFERLAREFLFLHLRAIIALVSVASAGMWVGGKMGRPASDDEHMALCLKESQLRGLWGKMGIKRIVNGALGIVGLRLARKERPEPWSHDKSPEMLHSHMRTAASYSPWLADRDFLAAYEKIHDFTLVDVYRCYELWSFAKDSRGIDGAILEVGVWRGGTGCLMAQAAPDKRVYLADTFEGVVSAGERDTRYVGGEHSDTSEELVRQLLADAGVGNARLLKGMFPAQTSDAVIEPVSLLHVDVDVYQSAKDTVEWALPRMPIGSRIVFDDYGFYGCEGVTRFVNQLYPNLVDFSFVHNLNGHAILIRTSNRVR
ncbi:MAG: TylF/MycF/NovP-related O-methyltransferase [Acidobacteriaceae bacterium]